MPPDPRAARALADGATVDVHAHVLLPGVLGWCGAAGPELGQTDGVDFFRAGDYVIRHVKFRESPMSDPGQRLALMDRLGIDHQIMSPYPMVYFYRQPAADAGAFARRHNDEMAALIRAHPRRLSGFATLPMQAPDAAGEVAAGFDTEALNQRRSYYS